MAETQKFVQPKSYYYYSPEKLNEWANAWRKRMTPEEREAIRKRNQELELHFITCNMYLAMHLNRMIDDLGSTLSGKMLEKVEADRDRALTNAQYGRDARFVTGDAIWDEPYRSAFKT